MSSPSSQPASDKTGAVIRRLLRDYVSEEWGLLFLAILCMLVASATTALVPQVVNWEGKYIFQRHDAAWLVPLSAGAFGPVGIRAGPLFPGRVWGATRV